MPAKKKKKTTPKGKKSKENDNSSSSASSECNYSRTLEILNKITRKYMATEVGYEGDEEASTATSDMSTQSPSQTSSSLYDFDEPDMETSPILSKNKGKTTKVKKTGLASSKSTSLTKKGNPVNTKGKKSCKTSNKDTSSEDKQLKKRSLKQKSNKQNQENISATTKARKDSALDTTKGHAASVNSSQCVSMCNSPMFSKTPVVSLQRLDLSNVEGYDLFQRQLRKRKCEVPKDLATPQIKPKLLKPNPTSLSKISTASSKRQQRKRDSGVLMSPPSLHKIPAPASTDTSTPSSTVPQDKQKKSAKAEESCFGFDKSLSFADASITVSPVRRSVPLTPLSDYVSMDSMQFSFDDISRRQSVDSSIPELFSMEEEMPTLNRSSTKTYKTSSGKRKPKTAKTKKASSTKSKVDDIAEKLNTEFDEIERFQLSIEEMY